MRYEFCFVSKNILGIKLILKKEPYFKNKPYKLIKPKKNIFFFLSNCYLWIKLALLRVTYSNYLIIIQNNRSYKKWSLLNNIYLQTDACKDWSNMHLKDISKNCYLEQLSCSITTRRDKQIMVRLKPCRTRVGILTPRSVKHIPVNLNADTANSTALRRFCCLIKPTDSLITWQIF